MSPPKSVPDSRGLDPGHLSQHRAADSSPAPCRDRWPGQARALHDGWGGLQVHASIRESPNSMPGWYDIAPDGPCGMRQRKHSPRSSRRATKGHRSRAYGMCRGISPGEWLAGGGRWCRTRARLLWPSVALGLSPVVKALRCREPPPAVGSFPSWPGAHARHVSPHAAAKSRVQRSETPVRPSPGPWQRLMNRPASPRSGSLPRGQATVADPPKQRPPQANSHFPQVQNARTFSVSPGITMRIATKEGGEAMPPPGMDPRWVPVSRWLRAAFTAACAMAVAAAAPGPPDEFQVSYTAGSRDAAGALPAARCACSLRMAASSTPATATGRIGRGGGTARRADPGA